MHLTALVRDRAGNASGVPVTLIVTRPDGVEHTRVALTQDELGGHTTTLRLAPSSMTGTWRARLHADPSDDPLTSVAFLVEDFLPERLEMTIDPVAEALRPGQPGVIKVSGRYLYGAPAAGLAIEGDIVVRPAAGGLAAYPDYQFGLADDTVSPVRNAIDGLASTDSEGRAELHVMLPSVPRTARPLEAELFLRLREPSGRTIERSVTLPLEVPLPRIGLKPLFRDGRVSEGTIAEFDVIHLGSNGERARLAGAKWQLVRLEQRWQWYNRDGYWAYEPITLAQKVASGVIDIDAEKPARIAAQVDWGRYRLEVASADAGGPASSTIFTAGWYSEDGTDSPEALEIALDKPSYNVGDVARLKIEDRYGGRAFVAVLGDGLLASQEVELPKGGGELTIPVERDWGPGAYVTAMLYRPMDEQAKRMPSRAIGVAWLPLDQSARTLNVSLEAQPQVRSGAGLTVPIKLEGLASEEEARVTVAAVDVGILNLTRYEAPAPERWFLGQRRLGTEIRDYYGRLIDGMRAERGRLRSGGDAEAVWGCRAVRLTGKRSLCSPASSVLDPMVLLRSISTCRISTALSA